MKPQTKKKPSNKSGARNTKQGKNKQSLGEIRIIGGQWRGRKLKVHDKEGLRPTTDRLKETLFNWLMMDIRNAKVLDCFAGAGSLSFEAGSRGASKVVSIEKDKQAAKQLQQNAQSLNALSLFKIVQGDFFAEASALSGHFDIVFIDPPFHKSMTGKTIKLLKDKELLTEGALVYLEQESNSSFELLNSEYAEQFELVKEKRAGQVLAQVFRFLSLD